MRYIFRGFSRRKHAVREPEDGITIALVQDLKRCRLAFRRVFQQPLVCLVIPQSKRSILQDSASYCCITTKGHEVTEIFCRSGFSRPKLYVAHLP